MDNVDVAAATRRGIVVVNAPESTVISAAEHTVGLLVALARNIPQAHARSSRAAGSARSGAAPSSRRRRSASLGLGRIGQQVARRALGLGMRVVAYDPFVARSASASSASSAPSRRRSVYAAADFVTLPSAAHRRDARARSTREAFARMRDGVRIVNAARGELDRRGRRSSRRSARARSPARRSTSSRPSRTRARCSSSTTSSSRRTSPRRPPRRRTAPASSSPSRSRPRSRAAWSRTPSTSRRSRAEDADALGAVRPARRGARRGSRSSWPATRSGSTLTLPRRARRARHAPAHRLGAQRRVPGPRRPAGELGERAARRGRARHRGQRGAPPLVPRLHQPRRVARRAVTARRRASRGRRSAARTGAGS